MAQKTTDIPLSKLQPCRWGTGIRDKDTYERLKENIKVQGLNSPLKVWPVGDEKYEPFIGDHRMRILKELGHKSAPCIIEDITEEEALERCIGDNICRANYSSEELESKVSNMFESGRYNSFAALGRKIGLTGERVGQLISAHKDRKELSQIAKGPFDCSTQLIVDSRCVPNINERYLLLQQVKKGNIQGNHIRKVAKALQTMDEQTKKNVLTGKQSYYGVIGDVQSKLNKKKVKEKKATITIGDPEFLRHIYDCSKQIPLYLLSQENDSKRKAIDYTKMSIACMLDALVKVEAITEVQYTSIRDNILKIKRYKVDNFNGEPLDGGIAKYVH